MSTAALPVHVALVDDSHSVDPHYLAEVAGALNEQVAHDFAPVWKVAATVGAYPKAPAGTWAIHLRRDIDAPGALGYHADAHRQPYALVDVDAGDWELTTSHELLEMLADPWGSRRHTARAPRGWTGPARVRYLVEVCDPCEAVEYAVGGFALSDFLTPYYYRSTTSMHPASHTGELAPLEVLDGGYITWQDPATDEWWQRFVDNGEATDRNLGRFDARYYGSLREFSDAHARAYRVGL